MDAHQLYIGVTNNKFHVAPEALTEVTEALELFGKDDGGEWLEGDVETILAQAIASQRDMVVKVGIIAPAELKEREVARSKAVFLALWLLRKQVQALIRN